MQTKAFIVAAALVGSVFGQSSSRPPMSSARPASSAPAVSSAPPPPRSSGVSSRPPPPPSSVVSMRSMVSSKSKPHEVTTTKVVSRYTTYCPVPTTVCIGTKTYTVTEPTTLTITDCPCTITETHKKPYPTKEVPPPNPPPVKTTNAPQPPPVKPTGVVTAGAEGRSAAYGFAMAAAGVVGALAL
ncbi:hypothetical protein VFPPC_05062 [Pochonia chlamydosporia 170]|uniref:Mmc protein n=1 Tax=Pochonia chlamydosporia 170 TaxID=1380566 RepID=A0A179FUW5_METCM|nr:hypothetical protein VFPPC_05062 [Pochonia chlamydosporia 170]OAQ68901.1 hypothetical protein VFPPC_05062 [Pochonia chlamydosporia 170]